MNFKNEIEETLLNKAMSKSMKYLRYDDVDITYIIEHAI